VRSLLNGSMPATVAYPPNETIDQAWDLGALSQPTSVLGSVGTGAEGAADVTWYHFQLQDAARVDLSVTTTPGERPFDSVLSLYDSDPQGWNGASYSYDPYDPGGHLLLAQVQADPQDGVASSIQDLGPGDYYVAVSGAGNTAFSPVVAGSGFPGAMGEYEFTAGATDLGLAGDGPTMLWANPGAGTVLDSSPLAIRVELSGPIDPNTVSAGQTVQLLAVSGGVSTPVSLSMTNVSSTGDELQLFPEAPLAPGHYVVQLSGDASQGQVIDGLDGLPLGEDALHPNGTNESYSFDVGGIDGVAGGTASDDTPATARQLGVIDGAGLVQVAGAIGVDPSFNPALAPDPYSPDPPDNPANQVDLYHFQISGPGQYALLAEVFAGRIGSPLDPGMALYKLDPSTGQLVFVVGNNNTEDPAQGTDGSVPLLLDSALTAGLDAGNYYIAVADGSNIASPLEGQAPGSPGIFVPGEAGSAQNGQSTGAYVLNLTVQPAPPPLRVLASSPSPGQVLGAAPTQISVQFSQAIDLQQLDYQAYETSYQAAAPEVFIEGSDGTEYEPRFLGYNHQTNTATFEMLDGLPNGSYTLHLSGADGLTDLAGVPIAGNTPGGDYVIPFTVRGPAGDLTGSRAAGFWTVAQPGTGLAQNIGLMYPDELQAGVTILRYPVSPTAAGADATQDSYTFRVMESQYYTIGLIGSDLPAGTQLSMTDGSGDPVPLGFPSGPQQYTPFLSPGTYTISVGGWTAGAGAGLSYQLLVSLGTQQDNAPPLTDSPAPAIQVSLAGLSAFAGASSGTAGTAPGLPIAASPTEGGTTGTIGGGGATAIGGAGVGAAVGGGTGGGGAVLGSGADTPSGSPAAGGSLAEAAVSLAGLGMGPLGGSGGAAAPLSSPAIQVALNAPSGGSSASTTVAIGLVTLTHMFSWTHDGDAVAPPEAETPPEAEASDPTATLADFTAAAEGAPPAGPQAAPAAAVVVVEAPANAAGPEPGLAIRIDPPVAPATVEPAPSEGAFSLVVSPRATTDGSEAIQPAAANWAGPWVIAAATIAAVYGSRDVIRGLQWRRGMRTGGAGWRSIEPVSTKGPHSRRSLAEAVSRPHSARVVLQRSRVVQAASPRP
jgi:methionine-rich copper-binding protein CopC